MDTPAFLAMSLIVVAMVNSLFLSKRFNLFYHIYLVKHYIIPREKCVRTSKFS